MHLRGSLQSSVRDFTPVSAAVVLVGVLTDSLRPCRPERHARTFHHSGAPAPFLVERYKMRSNIAVQWEIGTGRCFVCSREGCVARLCRVALSDRMPVWAISVDSVRTAARRSCMTASFQPALAPAIRGTASPRHQACRYSRRLKQSSRREGWRSRDSIEPMTFGLRESQAPGS
jgi:hypothetical protein